MTYPTKLHLLMGGMTPCGLGPTEEKPQACQWMPVGELWVPATALDKVTCPECLAWIQEQRDNLKKLLDQLRKE